MGPLFGTVNAEVNTPEAFVTGARVYPSPLGGVMMTDTVFVANGFPACVNEPEIPSPEPASTEVGFMVRLRIGEGGGGGGLVTLFQTNAIKATNATRSPYANMVYESMLNEVFVREIKQLCRGV